MSRAIGVVLAVLLFALAWYASPWWPFRLWDNPGLLGMASLRPGGDVVAFLTRGTPLAPYDLMIWGTGCFLVLTLFQKVWNRITGA